MEVALLVGIADLHRTLQALTGQPLIYQFDPDWPCLRISPINQTPMKPSEEIPK